jgi:uncharacterized membrane protein YgcG
MIMRRLLLAVFVFLAAQVSAFAQERIVSFISDVRVQPNGDLDVTETITIQAEGSQFRRGIFRDFPTSYRSRSDGTNVIVGFDVISVTRNGQPENYTTESYSNGVRTRIGRADVIIPRGQHTYAIRYRTTRQIGFFDKFDELYWNATGNGWNFAIDTAEARITLPQGAQIGQNALYTGPQGATGKDARVVEQSGNRIVWRTTRRLSPYEGLTVAVAWQKGIVAPPSGVQKAAYFLQDNLPILASLIGLLGVGFFYLSTWSRVGRDPASGTIIPLFSPPNNLSPAEVRYLDRLSFDNRAFTAAIVNLGVKGHLTLSESSSTSRVTLKEGNLPLSESEDEMRRHLFAKSKTVELKQESHEVVGAAKSALEKKLYELYAGKLFSNNFGWSFLGFFLAVIAVCVLLYAIASTRSGGAEARGIFGVIIAAILCGIGTPIFLAGASAHRRPNLALIGGAVLWVLGVIAAIGLVYINAGVDLNLMIPGLAAALLVSLAFAGFRWLKAPSREGQHVRDQISGFREYLGVAEEDRLNALHPPKKTPELFEKFLPYAIALDVENEWGKKFAGVLAAAAAAGAAGYAWYHGQRDWSRDPAGFSSHLGSAVASAISSASTAPGSSSGSSGSGSSGGGGGGGGGGGW